MLANITKKIFGTQNDRDLKAFQPIVDQINVLEPQMLALSDEALKAKTQQFKEHLAQIENEDKRIAELDNILPQVFAVCREAGRRALGMRHFDVQLIGGIALHQGKIAEMRTGEGKTLVATLPVYLNALLGKGVHVVTVNDYLAKRDSEWMGRLYTFLGLTVGNVVNGMMDDERRKAYACDVTYGQNNEFGFDYLRDNMKYRLEDYVQREHFFAIVDEVDSILIDEARTPLIISGPTDDSTDKYYVVNKVIPHLTNEKDYTLDEKTKNALLTEQGVAKVEELLKIDNLYAPGHMELVHHVNQALRAHTLFHKDVDYMVKDGEVMIVDEFTGRLMHGRRWSDGLHQAIEAKEGVNIENENQTLASITFQNYFRMFKKLSGMTGTAETEAEEFHKIYKLDVMVIPTNKPIARLDHPDIIYRTEQDKFKYIADDIKEKNVLGQPVLVGTVSIEKSEKLSSYLKRLGVKHNVLNAKQHENEAGIVKHAGQKGQVTIATNMAGRGTDIVLGEGVVDLGGLHIIGTERHESRRIDNQLRGRAGRQGDPGSSRFYLSLEDDLMRIFASDWVQKLLDWAGMKDGEAIEHKMTTKAIENAQRTIEGQNFDIRKHLLKYDDVMNQQRQVIYTQRKAVLGEGAIDKILEDDIETVAEELVIQNTNQSDSKEWDWDSLEENLKRVFNFSDEQVHGVKTGNYKTQEDLRDKLCDEALANLAAKQEEYSSELMDLVKREIKLRTIDGLWKDHLLNMDHLKEAVGWEGYAQKDPLVVYRIKGFEMFSQMLYSISQTSLERIFHVQVDVSEQGNAQGIFAQRSQQRAKAGRGEGIALPNRPKANDTNIHTTVRREGEKVGRNDPCPCGSGKKYKKCHGAD
ncbi:MAG TPA: preprotein translocase subunit SecA [Oligoflexia bacterium]|nr:preprotein translocase subunit SecA [Oligoflexia bacterium]HMR25697.1 preprotein translocase subunit SecA [Oligoflexia bacterium]